MRRTATTWLIPLVFALTATTAATTAMAQSTNAPAVLELYTSQGCSSCPPADKLIQSYAERRDIVALSFNVDYWDYLGWKDTLGSAAFSKRQRTYAMKRGDGEVYTPQVVVNGMAHAIGSVANQIDSAISRTSRRLSQYQVPMDVRHTGGKLIVEIGDGPVAKRPATVWLASVRSSVTVPVKHGENRGRTLTYYNVVRKMSPIGMWSGKRTVIQLKDEDVLHGNADTCAILVQLGKGGPIIAARWMPDQS